MTKSESEDDYDREMRNWSKPAHYKVVLLMPPHAEDEMQNAAAFMQPLLEELSKHPEHLTEMGLRFADNVTAELDAERTLGRMSQRLNAEKDIAAVFAYGFSNDQLRPLVEQCNKRNVKLCHVRAADPSEMVTTEEDAETLGEEPRMQLQFRNVRPPGELACDQIDQTLVIDPVPSSPEVIEDRQARLLFSLSTGVMRAHGLKSRARE